MKVLAIETSTLTGSVALLSDGGVIGERTLSVSVQHSERLMPAIVDLLRDVGVTRDGVDLFAVATGPGSFTGLRIGLAAAQGLALAHGRPVVGVSTLEGLAFHGLYYPGVVVPMLNAYRNELYWGAYRGADGVLTQRVEDRVSPVAEFVLSLRRMPEKCLLVGDGLKIYEKFILAELGPEKIEVVPTPFQNPKATHIAHLALKEWERGMMSDPLPRYLRKPG